MGSLNVLLRFAHSKSCNAMRVDVASKRITQDCVQLVVAAKVKARPSSDKLHGLEEAEKDVLIAKDKLSDMIGDMEDKKEGTIFILSLRLRSIY